MFVHPIKDPKGITMMPLTLAQLASRVSTMHQPRLRLVLSKLETGWVIELDHPEGHFALGHSDGVAVRVFRKMKSMSNALSTLGLSKVAVPINSDLYRQHAAFCEARQKWLQDQLGKKKLTNQKIGDRTGQHNGYVSQVLAGTAHQPDIEALIAEEVGLPLSALFPEIPDQLL